MTKSMKNSVNLEDAFHCTKVKTTRSPIWTKVTDMSNDGVVIDWLIGSLVLILFFGFTENRTHRCRRSKKQVNKVGGQPIYFLKINPKVIWWLKQLLVYGPEDFWELYDLKKDPNELHNLYGQTGYESLTADLKAKLRVQIQSYKDNEPSNFWTVNCN